MSSEELKIYTWIATYSSIQISKFQFHYRWRRIKMDIWEDFFFNFRPIDLFREPLWPQKCLPHFFIFNMGSTYLAEKNSWEPQIFATLHYITISNVLQISCLVTFGWHLDLIWRSKARTTDALRGKSLHCTAEISIPIQNF